MSFAVSNRLKQIKPSDTLTLSALANQLKAAGEPIINLTAGEPDFITPEPIRRAVISALEQGEYTQYTPVEGTVALKQAIIEKFQRDHQLHYSPKQIIAATGAKQVIYNALQALLNPGDEVIMPAPYWVSYPSMVNLSDGITRPLLAGIEQSFKITPSQLQQAITPRTRLIILNSPCNPTGAVYSREELYELGNLLLQHPKIFIISDDIYDRITWTDTPFFNIVQACPELYDRTLIVNGVSKTYAMTGWRLGYGAGPSELIQAMSVIQSQSTSCPNALAQLAAQIALIGDQSCIAEMKQAYQSRNQLVTNALKRIPGVQCLPAEGAFYSFPSFKEVLEKTNHTDASLAQYLLEKAKLATVPGSGFGAPGHLRLSFSLDESTLKEGMDRLYEAILKLL